MWFFDLQRVGKAARCYRAASAHVSGVLFPEPSLDRPFVVVSVEQIMVGVAACAA
ncbi:hypothetical protein MA3A0930S_3616 [Mycobacteroides abscessus 3A-0930-S]|nr:hypothetical protein MA6G0728S_3317 [Mycobacteroides abscessus 6G-0728-S]EIV49407.1 hypothetical protein MA3A0930S_3616 [Mycobacteroides abscessus 3A-0930-S]EUA79619.1 hypothetical protein I544_0909 [Mycobacteroides abscessus subsp. bolletii 103]